MSEEIELFGCVCSVCDAPAGLFLPRRHAPLSVYFGGTAGDVVGAAGGGAAPAEAGATS